MLRMFAKRWFQVSTAGGSDEALFGVALPSDSVLHGIKGNIAVWGTQPQVLGKAALYGVAGFILPVLDPDAAASIDTLWDTLVPKDTDVQAIDLDTAAADATPYFEPGEADWSDVLDVGLRPTKIFEREKLLTPASGAISMNRDPATPFAYEWIPGDQFQVNITKRYRVSQPSVVILAFSSPQLDDVASAVPVLPLENEWPRIKYAGQMLEQAMIDLFGLSEAAGEDPWQHATDTLQLHLMPDVYEQSTDFFDAQTLQCVGSVSVDHSVVGRIDVDSISLA